MTQNTQANNTLESLASARALYYDYFERKCFRGK